MTDIVEIMARAMCCDQIEAPDDVLVNKDGKDFYIWETHVYAANQVLTALQAAGYVVVPKEPTEAMLQAGRVARMNIEGGYGGPGPWEAMLAASGK